MLTSRQLVQSIKPRDWFVTIDLKDAYFHIPIYPRHQRFLQFAFRGKAHQFCALPFGLALAPRVFTKCVEAAIAPLRQQRLSLFNYLDEFPVVQRRRQSKIAT